jgi:tetratricopeptide (TPR) repeat protein
MNLLYRSLCLTFLSAISLVAQDAPSEGDIALQQKDWAKAEQFFHEATTKNSRDGRSWFQLGIAFEGEQKYHDASAAFDHALQENEQTARALFHKAIARVQLRDVDSVFATLNELNKQGFMNLNALKSDPRLEPLRSDSRWQGVVEVTYANANPCEHTPENRQFDFWIGEWDVQTTTGQPAGTSKIERIVNGCALLENWSGGGPGKSLNSYNTVRKQWQQFWVDSGGEVHEYAGNLVDGEMQFEGPAADHQGNKTLRRMVFHRLDGGRVKQTGFTSPDGKEWTVEYELIYIPKSL